MAKIDYKLALINIKEAPKGKIPYVNFEGKLIGDSELIINLLKQKYGDPLDQKLTALDRANAIALTRLTEEHLYFAAAWLRWTEEISWPYVRRVFLDFLPPLIGKLILKKIRKDFLHAIHAQGMGRHSQEEILAFAKADIETISLLLGDKKFFLGNEPTSLDATMFGFLIQNLWVPWESELTRYSKTFPNLSAYCKRMKDLYWSDLSSAKA